MFSITATTSLNQSTPSWANPISINPFGEGSEEPLGDLFEPSAFDGFDPLAPSPRPFAPKRKGDEEHALPARADGSSKRSKSSKLGSKSSFAHVIEPTGDLEEMPLNEEDLLALSDALTDSADSFDESSVFDEEESNDSAGEDDDDFFGKGDDEAGKKSRGNYACSKCGMAKRGHMCAFQPRIRRRTGGSGGPAAAAVVPTSGGASIPAGLPRIASSKAAPRIKIAAAEPVQRCEMAVGPSALFVVAPKGPAMVSTGSQCELEPSNTVRELYLDSQGFPESYAHGIQADPLFNLGTARTVTVSRPAPKSYKPRSKTSSSCGAGPDLMSAMSSSPFLSHPLLGQPLDPLGLMRGPGLAPSLTLSHLALLMSSYQHSLAHAMPHSLAHGSGEIDPALASLFFPVTSTMPQAMGRRE